ncbi:MAG: hypothetical protein Q9M89_02045 [Persephonella sp.]|nr:hypothetical protein [Persephonella sp.]
MRIVRKKGKSIVSYKREIIKLSGVFSRFEPGVNIFRLHMGNLIGKNSVFFARKNLTLIEIAKIL